MNDRRAKVQEKVCEMQVITSAAHVVEALESVARIGFAVEAL